MNVPFFRPWFPDDLVEEINQDTRNILASGRLIPGEYNKRLENEFSTHCGRTEAVALNSCTTALTLCVQHYLPEGGEVIVASASFLTSISSVLFGGGTPVLADCNPKTLTFSPEELEKRITPQTRAIIWVHLTGIISDEFKQIQKLAKAHGLALIEDCAHALGASVEGMPAGSLGDAACFSFYPTKVITCGSGGMLVTDDETLANTARQKRLFGKDPVRGEVTALGNDWYLDELRAAMAWRQMLRLDENMEHRHRLAAHYEQLFSEEEHWRLLPIRKENSPSFYHFCLFTDPGKAEILNRRLKDKHGVETKIIYKPCHHEEVFRHLDTGDLQKTEETLYGSVCLPFHTMLGEAEMEYVAEKVRAEAAKA